jgi:hypothetical protein
VSRKTLIVVAKSSAIESFRAATPLVLVVAVGSIEVKFDVQTMPASLKESIVDLRVFAERQAWWLLALDDLESKEPLRPAASLSNPLRPGLAQAGRGAS